MDFDFHLGGNIEPAVWTLQLDTRDDVAKRVRPVAAPIVDRRNLDGMLHAFLKWGRTRDEMQKLVGMHHVASICIRRFVPYLISHAGVLAAQMASARASAPVCEKCRIESRSDSCAAAIASARS